MAATSAIPCPVRSATITMSGAAMSAGRLARDALLAQLGFASWARGGGGLRQRRVERGLDRRDAFAIVRHDRGQSSREVDVAQEPDQTVEQQVLDRLIELELQPAGNLVV